MGVWAYRRIGVWAYRRNGRNGRIGRAKNSARQWRRSVQKVIRAGFEPRRGVALALAPTTVCLFAGSSYARSTEALSKRVGNNTLIGDPNDGGAIRPDVDGHS